MTATAGVLVPAFATATLLLWFLARPYGNPRWKLASASALTAAGVALLADQPIAHAWLRSRPYLAHPAATHLLASRTADPSFPSDHAAAAAAIAVAILGFSLRVGIGFGAAAVLVGLSRVALGAHYPSDVAVGFLVGIASGLVVLTAGRGTVCRLVRVVSRLTDPVVAWARRGLARG